jgi:hypothetical protein
MFCPLYPTAGIPLHIGEISNPKRLSEKLDKKEAAGQTCWMTKSQQAYPTDLNDTDIELIHPYLPKDCSTCHPRVHSWRAILNAIFYMTKNDCCWNALPHDLSPWKIV